VGIVRLPEFQGSVVLYINEYPIGIIATNVPDNLYGFIELQDCEGVALTPRRTVDEVSELEYLCVRRNLCEREEICEREKKFVREITSV